MGDLVGVRAIDFNALVNGRREKSIASADKCSGCNCLLVVVHALDCFPRSQIPNRCESPADCRKGEA